MSKGRIVVIIIWSFTLILSYIFLIPQTITILSDYGLSPSKRLVDAIVLIAMGKMAEDSMVDFSISSIRKIGNWKGDIYLLTDRDGCFTDAKASHDLKIVAMNPLNTIIEIKALKPKLLQYLPESVSVALYLDVDILVTRDLGAFLADLEDTVIHNSAFKKVESKSDNERVDSIAPALSNNSQSSEHFDYGAFLDSGGHYVGFCSGCEKWHTGIMLLQRRKIVSKILVANETLFTGVVSNATMRTDIRGFEMTGGVAVTEGRGKEIGRDQSCMEAWEKILMSGMFTTDQESIDEAERIGACPRALVLPSKHLLFAKDYIGMMLTSGQTFLHLTAAGRIESQDYFYREMVVPRLRNSLKPTLNPDVIKTKKTC